MKNKPPLWGKVHRINRRWVTPQVCRWSQTQVQLWLTELRAVKPPRSQIISSDVTDGGWWLSERDVCFVIRASISFALTHWGWLETQVSQPITGLTVLLLCGSLTFIKCYRISLICEAKRFMCFALSTLMCCLCVSLFITGYKRRSPPSETLYLCVIYYTCIHFYLHLHIYVVIYLWLETEEMYPLSET